MSKTGVMKNNRGNQTLIKFWAKWEKKNTTNEHKFRPNNGSNHKLKWVENDKICQAIGKHTISNPREKE